LGESAKAADARPEAGKELSITFRGALDTDAVLRGFLGRLAPLKTMRTTIAANLRPA
jgi:hypothetical protein